MGFRFRESREFRAQGCRISGGRAKDGRDLGLKRGCDLESGRLGGFGVFGVSVAGLSVFRV